MRRRSRRRCCFLPQVRTKASRRTPETAKEGDENKELTTKEAVSGGLGIIQFIVAIALVVVGFSALLSTCSWYGEQKRPYFRLSPLSGTGLYPYGIEGRKIEIREK